MAIIQLAIAVISLLSAISDAQIFTFLRRDYFLPQATYPEGLPDPDVGGRIHMVMAAKQENETFATYSTPYTVQFDTLAVKIDPSTTLPDIIDWMYVDYNSATGQIWLSAHIPTDDLLDEMQMLTITDSNQNVMAKYYNVQFVHTGLQMYYVTAVEKQVVMHFYCYYTDTAFDIATLYWNGQQIATDIAVGPLQHTVVTYNSSTAIQPGDIYTVSVVLEDGLRMGWGGKLVNPIQPFPVAASVIDSQCPYPDTNESNYDILTSDLGINSMYLSSNTTCNHAVSDILEYYDTNWNDSNTVNYTTLFLEDSLSSTSNGLSSYTNLPDFVSILTVYDEIKPVDENAHTVNTTVTAHNIWQQSLKRRLFYPNSMTLTNSMTNHEVGSYCGITDIQCATFFMSGCRPTALTENNDLNPFPVTAVYDYYRNARLNNQPQPIWGAVEAFSEFEGGGYLTAAEVTLSIGQALAAGVNGFHVVATDVTQQTTNANAWKSASKLMKSVQYLERTGLLKVASADGANVAVSGNGTSLWSALRTVSDLIVIGVNVHCEGYDPAQCSSTNTPHWSCDAVNVESVNISIPSDWSADGKALTVQVMEIVNGESMKPDFDVSLQNNDKTLVFNQVSLDSNDTTRIFRVSPQN